MTDGWSALLNDVCPDVESHVDLADLGQCAALASQRGQSAAASAFPEIVAHIGAPCPRCRASLAELQAFLELEDAAAPRAQASQRGAAALPPSDRAPTRLARTLAALVGSPRRSWRWAAVAAAISAITLATPLALIESQRDTGIPTQPAPPVEIRVEPTAARTAPLANDPTPPSPSAAELAGDDSPGPSAAPLADEQPSGEQLAAVEPASTAVEPGRSATPPGADLSAREPPAAPPAVPPTPVPAPTTDRPAIARAEVSPSREEPAQAPQRVGGDDTDAADAADAAAENERGPSAAAPEPAASPTARPAPAAERLAARRPTRPAADTPEDPTRTVTPTQATATAVPTLTLTRAPAAGPNR